MIRTLAVLCIALALTGCRWGARECASTPVIVEVPVSVREPIPAALTEPIDASACAAEGPTVGDVRRQRAQACAAIEAGNARFRELRDLRPQ